MTLSKKNYAMAIVICQAFILFIILNISQKALGLNSYNQQGKASNFIGYRVLDDHSIQVFLDKSGANAEAAEFHIFRGTSVDGENISIEKLTVASEINFSGLKGQMPSGSSFILNTSQGAFKAGETYTVVINNNITFGSGPLGWFNSHNDEMISFTIPNTFGDSNNSDYSNSCQAILNSWPLNNANNVPVEGDIWITSSIPIKNYSEVMQNIIVKKSGIKLRYDNYLFTGTDTIPNDNADIFAPIISDDHNSIIIPLTVGYHIAPCYNLDANTKYEVIIPEIETVNGQVLPEHSIIFHTAGSTVASKFKNGIPTGDKVEDSIKIDWSNIAPPSATVANTSGIPGPAFVSPPASGYNVYASTDKYWDYVKLNSYPINGTFFDTTNCGLKPNTSYYFRVSALSNTNVLTGATCDIVESGFSDAIQLKTPMDTRAPVWLADSKIDISNITSNSLVLNWQAAQDSSGVQAYKIYLNGSLIDTLSGNITTYKVSSLKAGTEYNFKIEAGDLSDNWTNNGPSNNVKTLDKNAPYWSEESVLMVSNVEGNSLTLNWTPAQDDVAVATYGIYENGKLIDLVNGNETSYNIENLKPYNKYIFKIEARDDANNWTTDGPFQEVKTKDTIAPTWETESVVKASNITPNSVSLNWTDAHDTEGVAFYNIYENNTLIKTVDGNTTTFNVNGLEASAKYTFKIEAGDNSGNWSIRGPSVTCKTLDNYIAVPTYSLIMSEHNSIEIGLVPVTEAVKVAVYDQYGNEMPAQKVTWSIAGQPIGISINQNGIMTIQPFASIGTIIVKDTVNGTNIISIKKYEIIMPVATKYITFQDSSNAIASSLNSDTVSLPDSNSELIVVDGKALLGINNIDKYINISNSNNINFKFKPRDLNLGSNSLTSIRQLQIGCESVDFLTKNQLITDNMSSSLLFRNFSLVTLPFKLSAGVILNDGSQQQITSFGNPIAVSIPVPLGLSILDNETLKVCRFNTDTYQWEDKGIAEIKDGCITFKVSGFSYWAVILGTKDNSSSSIEDGSNKIATVNYKNNAINNSNTDSVSTFQLNSVQNKSNVETATGSTSSTSNGNVISNSKPSITGKKEEVKVSDNERKTDKKSESLLGKFTWKVWVILFIVLLLIFRITFVVFKYRRK